MLGSRNKNEPQQDSLKYVSRESGNESSEDDDEILEESPCGRWLKRREKVNQRDVPGIDNAFLSMDTEDGVEVVWNEVQFSERKNYKAQEEKIQQIFENLTHLDHPNIVKFHRYWTDTHNDRPRVIFITEYMSSGCLKQFLKRTKHNVKKLPIQAWKKWCSQILSALSYLHSCCPPIVHGNLTCDTIFIQHNGLLKIGSVAPDTINQHVKTYPPKKLKHTEFLAPEYGDCITPAIDIYSFGICALQMANLDAQFADNSPANEEDLVNNVRSLEDQKQTDFILKCIAPNPYDRPTARELLFHSLLFEVHSLKLLAAHVLVKQARGNISEIVSEELEKYKSDRVIATMKSSGGDNVSDIVFTVADIHISEQLEKFVEDVRVGIYPLTAYKPKTPPPTVTRPSSPELLDHGKSSTPEPIETESRHIVNMMCNIRPKDSPSELMMTILLRMEDKMNRQLTCTINKFDSASVLSNELVQYGFINQDDKEKVSLLIEEALTGVFQDDSEDSISSSPVNTETHNRSIVSTN